MYVPVAGNGKLCIYYLAAGETTQRDIQIRSESLPLTLFRQE